MNIVTIISSFVSGLLCSMGFGGGSVLIIYLTSYLGLAQKEAQGINLLFFIPCALYSVFSYKKDNLIDKNIFKAFTLWGAIGVLAGYVFISFVPSYFLRKAFGILLIAMGIKDIFTKSKK